MVILAVVLLTVPVLGTFAAVEEEPVSTRAGQLETDVEYAVITTNTLASSFQPLADWKTDKGVKAMVYTTQDIAVDYSGDGPKRIHDFLVDLKASSPGLEWVLIGGDADVVPARQLYAGASIHGTQDDYGQDYYASDFYYAGLGSIWDPSGNGIYGENGEEDFYADVYVGRLPVSSTSEVDTSVNRIISYERDSVAGDWQNKAVMSAGLMTAPNNVTEYDDYKDNAYKAIQYALPFADPVFDVDILYDYDELDGGNYTMADDTLNNTAFTGAIEDGCSVISFAGQAFYQDNLLFGNSLAQYEDMIGETPYHFEPLFQHTDAAALTNGDELPLAFFATCDCGNYSEADDTNLEAIWANDQGGFIGLIASTGHSFRGEYSTGGSYGNWWLYKKFYLELEEGNTQQGRLTYTMLGDYYAQVVKTQFGGGIPKELGKMNLYGYTLLGDPETDVITDQLDTMTVTANTVYALNGTATITVKDSSGAPVEGALVCLRADGLGVYSKGRTGSDGVVNLNVDPNNVGSLSMVVSAHNMVTHLSSVPVIIKPADVEVTSDDIDTGSLPLSENVPVTVTVTVRNLGQTAASNFDVQLYGGVDGTTLIGTKTVDTIHPAKERNLEFSWDPEGGTNILKVSVDAAGVLTESNVANNVATLTVSANTAPVFGTVPAIIVNEDHPAEVVLNLTDHVTDTTDLSEHLKFTLVSVTEPALGLTVSRNGEVYLYPLPNWSGNGTAVVQVDDGLATDTASLSITINSVDDVPQIDDPGDQSVELGKRFTMLITAKDEDGDVLTYSDDSDIFNIDPATGIIAFTEYETEGTFKVTITVSDGTNTASVTFNLTIGGALRIIEPTEEEMKAKEGETFTYTVTTNMPQCNITYSDDSDLFDIDPVTGEIEFKPGSDDVGTVEFMVTATDTNANETVTMDFEVEVEGKGDSPISMTQIIIIVVILIVIVVIIVVKFTWGKGKMAEEEEEEEEEEPKKKWSKKKDEEPEVEEGKGKKGKRTSKDPAKKVKDPFKKDGQKKRMKPKKLNADDDD